MIQEEILLSLQTLCNKKRGIRRDSSFFIAERSVKLLWAAR
ncbi:hypothetical protein IMSAG025_02176 [Muribaculaceae bacterium]|nr:hypothetical protein IMSAG025_02176 [Muribaculaceae bacterium]